MKKKLIACFTVIAVIFGWYVFTFYQLSNISPTYIGFMLAHDDFKAHDGHSPGYKYPIPPYALEMYFYNKKISKENITKLEEEGGLIYLFLGLHPGREKLHTEIADHLIENGLDINAYSKHGSTTLHMAAWTDSNILTRILIENGADLSLKANCPEFEDIHGLTALEIATKRMNERMEDGVIGSAFAKAAKDLMQNAPGYDPSHPTPPVYEILREETKKQ